MEDFKSTLLEIVSKIIREFDIQDMLQGESDIECEMLFSEEVINELKNKGFEETLVEQARSKLLNINKDVINSLTDSKVTFYKQLSATLENDTVPVILEAEYLRSGVVNKILFNYEGNMMFWAND